MRCPREYCNGFLEFQIGYIVYAEGMGAIHSEDRVVCVNCARYRYLTEQERSPSPKGRQDALPVEVLAAVAPAYALRRARRYVSNAQGKKENRERREQARASEGQWDGQEEEA